MTSEADLQQWVEKIVEQFHPVRVILFGSYATGQAGLNSDVDLLVVMPHSGKAFKMAAKIRLALREVLQHVVGIDILVRSPDELQQRLLMGDSFIKEILQQGRTLYDEQQF